MKEISNREINKYLLQNYHKPISGKTSVKKSGKTFTILEKNYTGHERISKLKEELFKNFTFSSFSLREWGAVLSGRDRVIYFEISSPIVVRKNEPKTDSAINAVQTETKQTSSNIQTNNEIGSQVVQSSSSGIEVKDMGASMLVDGLTMLSRKIVGEKGIHLQNSAFNNFVRIVFIGQDADERDLLFVKIPSGRYKEVQMQSAKNEDLSFRIAHALNLDVVPPTRTLGRAEIELCAPYVAKFPLHVDCCVIQAPVNLAAEQYHLEIPLESSKLKALDVNQVHKAILLNIILGRHDGRACNTVIDAQNRVMEVDNERIGLRTTDTWLIDSFEHTTLSPELVDSILKLDETLIHAVFDRLENKKDLKFIPATKANIAQNNKLKAFLEENRGQEIKVAQLKKINK